MTRQRRGRRRRKCCKRRRFSLARKQTQSPPRPTTSRDVERETPAAAPPRSLPTMALYHRLLLPAQEPNVTACSGKPCFALSPPAPASVPIPGPGPAPAPVPIPAPAPAPCPGPGPAPAPALAPPPARATSPAHRVVPYNTYVPPPMLSIPPPPVYPVNSKHDLTRTVVIIVASVLATCALLLTYYSLRRYRSSRRRRRAQAAAAAAAAELQQGPFDDDLRQDLLVGGGGPDEPYHVWYIRTAGLDEPTIGSIAAYAYRREEGVVEGTDCAVCLGEFRDGEMLRLLPKCSHAFHVPCVDTWLRSHVNCPLCRAPILSPPPPPAPPQAPVDVPVNPVPPSSSSAAAAHGSESSRRYMIPDGSADGGYAALAPSPARVVAGHHPDFSFSDEASDVWMQIDLGNGSSEEEGLIESHASAAAEEDGPAGLQQMRHRSVSMDSSALGGLLQRMGLTGRPTSEGNPSATKNGERRGSNRKGAALPDATRGMERSVSSGGARIFLSRFSGRQPTGILPP